MFRPARLIWLLTMVVMVATPALAQDDGGAPGAQPALERTFASAFFISRKADGSVELLGSSIIWLLLVLSAFSIGLIGSMAMLNRRRVIVPELVVDQVRQLLQAAKYREAIQFTDQETSFFSEIMHAALNESKHGFPAVVRSLEQTSDELTTIRMRRIEYLNVLGQVSPMIGLFGTVYGMILAFQAIVISGGNADPILLAGGIGTALTTTFWGLIVAIPALSGYAIIRSRIDELTTEATLAAEDMLNEFRPVAPDESGSGGRGGGRRRTKE